MRGARCVAEGKPEDLAAFHRRYWEAWDAYDLDGVAACLDDDFHGTFLGPDDAPAWQGDRPGVLEMLRATFAQYRQARGGWRRSGVEVLERGAVEAAAAMRVECLFPDHPEWNNSELTLESYRRGADGRWRISRAHCERLR